MTWHLSLAFARAWLCSVVVQLTLSFVSGGERAKSAKMLLILVWIHMVSVPFARNRLLFFSGAP